MPRWTCARRMPVYLCCVRRLAKAAAVHYRRCVKRR
nr:MAG TPA: hypothetical protein [Caudoviricetes sp.]